MNYRPASEDGGGKTWKHGTASDGEEERKAFKRFRTGGSVLLGILMARREKLSPILRTETGNVQQRLPGQQNKMVGLKDETQHV